MFKNSLILHRLRVFNDVLRIDLEFLKHNKNGWVSLVVNTAVVKALTVGFLWRTEKATVTPCEVSDQHQCHKHLLGLAVPGFCISVRV